MSSNNTNKFNPQEHTKLTRKLIQGSNNTNKFNPQELPHMNPQIKLSSNNTNKFNPQEPKTFRKYHQTVQIIQINSILKNFHI